ncbi:MAG: exodeoxyribonuclease VII [Moraxella sp.]|nr:exodeoxyribonuclease VII [Moraxella sp.]
MSSPKNFQEAYEILKANAQSIENSDELDIDNLVATIEQSIDAYKVCLARIQAVECALDKAFDEVSPSEN